MTPRLRGLTFKFQKHLSSHNFCGPGVAGCLCLKSLKGIHSKRCPGLWSYLNAWQGNRCLPSSFTWFSEGFSYSQVSGSQSLDGCWLGILSVPRHLGLSMRLLLTTRQRERERVTEKREATLMSQSFCNLGSADTQEQEFFKCVTPRRQGWPGARLKAAYYKEWDINFIKSLRYWGRWLLHLNLAYPYLIQFLFPIVQKKKLMLREI